MTQKNEAQSLLDRMGVTVKNSVTIAINDAEMSFMLDQAAFDAMVNQVTPTNKLTPLKDYLLAIVAPENRDDLLQIINLPGVAGAIAEAVNEELIPKIKITVKK